MHKSRDCLILFSSWTTPHANRRKVKIFSGKKISCGLFVASQSLSTVIPLYTYLHAWLMCSVYVCGSTYVVLCIWKVEVAWPMGSHFVEWWGSLLRRWVRRTSPHFVACHFTLRQTIRLTLSTPKLRHHHQLRCTQLYMQVYSQYPQSN